MFRRDHLVHAKWIYMLTAVFVVLSTLEFFTSHEALATTPDTEKSMVELIVVTDPDIPRQVLTFSLRPNETFTVSFLHSVEQTYVFEEFCLDNDGNLVLIATRYESFGAGLPFSQELGAFRQVGTTYILEDLNVVLGTFIVMVVPDNKYTIHFPLGVITFEHLPYGAQLHFRGYYNMVSH